MMIGATMTRTEKKALWRGQRESERIFPSLEGGSGEVETRANFAASDGRCTLEQARYARDTRASCIRASYVNDPSIRPRSNFPRAFVRVGHAMPRV